MRGEHIITSRELQTRFRGERDLVTCAPYVVGDRVVRCGNCHSIVKSEFVTSNLCPLCGHSPFVPALFGEESNSSILASRPQRSLKSYTWILLLSALFSLFPFSFSIARTYLSEAAFGLSAEWLILISLLVSITAVIALRFLNGCKRVWRVSKAGWLLSFVPAVAPYAFLCSIWIVIFAVQAVLAILAIGIVVCVVIGLCGGFDQ